MSTPPVPVTGRGIAVLIVVAVVAAAAALVVSVIASLPRSGTAVPTQSSDFAADAGSNFGSGNYGGPIEPPNSDELVCGDLERLGERFYVDMYEPLMTTGTFPQSGITAEEVGTVAAVVGVLSTIGSAEGEIDGSEAISHASQPVSEALARMTGDADRSAQRIVDSGLSGMVSGYDLGGVDLTPLVNSFTDSLIACTDAGHQPGYFDPHHLTGQ